MLVFSKFLFVLLRVVFVLVGLVGSFSSVCQCFVRPTALSMLSGIFIQIQIWKRNSIQWLLQQDINAERLLFHFGA